MKKANLERRQAEMKARLLAERGAPALRVLAIRACETERPLRKPDSVVERAAWLDAHPKRYREGIAFREMGRKLARYDRELRRERYVTAMLGVKTSWARILEAAKYAVCSEAELAS